VRSARSEHPGRFALVDLDGTDASLASLPAALVSEEPELCLRAGALLAARLRRVESDPDRRAPELDPEGTVLITGATGGLGALLARHLVETHGARHLVLTGRRGPDAPGAPELQADLEALGAAVAIVACDVADRAQVEGLLAGVPDSHPLVAVIHAAGVLDDGVVSSLDPERLRTVMAPKVDGAIHLHELTAGMALTHFVSYSSVAAILGSAGQANYAAANAFLDALAAARRAEGLAGLSIAWGAWEAQTGITTHLGQANLARLARAGMTALGNAEGLELFDLACRTDRALVSPVGIDMTTLRGHARAGLLPSIFSSLVRVSRRRATGERGRLARQLSGAGDSEADAIVLELVRTNVAAILGYQSPADVDPARAFKDLGFDSLGAVELRNGLVVAAGLTLPATLVFDHPTPERVAAYLRSRVADESSGRVVVDREVEAFAALLTGLDLGDGERRRVVAQLEGIAQAVGNGSATNGRRMSAEEVSAASASELFGLLDDRLGDAHADG
jgi:NADP-dependent 3-hydroxy acid dehydrogenase YdfG/acyl carrier protein